MAVYLGAKGKLSERLFTCQMKRDILSLNMKVQQGAHAASVSKLRRQQRDRRRSRPEIGKAAVSAAPAVLDSTRERILKSAGRLLAEQGFDNVSIRMIAKASRITPGAVYKHFSSKADLLFEAMERLVQSTPMMAQGAKDGDDGTLLPLVAAAYTEPDLKLLRQLSIEIHYASTRDKKVN